MEPIVTIVAIVVTAAGLVSGSADAPVNADGKGINEVSVMCPVPDTGEAKEDVFSVRKPRGFYSVLSEYGRVAEIKDWETESTIYFKAVRKGKDTVTVTTVAPDGSFSYTDYIIIVDDDMQITVFDILYDND